MSTPQSHAKGVTVYHYYTYLSRGEKFVAVESSRPATLDLIESLSAVPLMGSARLADPSQICELGFLRGESQRAHARLAS